MDLQHIFISACWWTLWVNVFLSFGWYWKSNPRLHTCKAWLLPPNYNGGPASINLLVNMHNAATNSPNDFAKLTVDIDAVVGIVVSYNNSTFDFARKTYIVFYNSCTTPSSNCVQQFPLSTPSPTHLIVYHCDNGNSSIIPIFCSWGTNRIELIQVI